MPPLWSAFPEGAIRVPRWLCAGRKDSLKEQPEKSAPRLAPAKEQVDLYE
jgi:hypothetical protein